MKTRFNFALIRIMILAAVFSSLLGAKAYAHGDGEGGPGKMADWKTERLKDKLNLSEDQTKQVHDIYAKYFTPDAATQEQWKKMKDEHIQKMEKANAEVTSVLNEEQKKKFEELKADHKDGKFGGRHGKHGHKEHTEQ
jgi:hypothetical protein